jgi:hypothetical protein
VSAVPQAAGSGGAGPRDAGAEVPAAARRVKGPLYPPERRELVAIDGALAMIAVLLIVQMWLLTAALEAYLAGHQETALPAAIVSGVLFAGCAGLYAFVRNIDRRRKR